MIAFRSTRDGRSRIWLKQLVGGGEAALTAGADDYPRFSPDGSSVLFVRAEGERSSLYRTALLGGEARKIVEDVIDGDWSPEAGQRDSFLGVAGADGQDVREIARAPGQALRGVRWSPDGRRLAAVWGGFRTGTTVAGILIVGADGTKPQTIKPPRRNGFLSSVAWSRGSEILVYSQAEWISGDMTGSMARVIRHELRSGASRTILWTPHSADILDILGPGRLVLDTRSPRENLRETLLGPQSAAPTRWLSRGNSNDRQPVYSPEGEWVVFASTRSGNSDLWEISTRSGTLRRLTEDPAEDVDPAVSPDGGTLVFSSDRGGHFEIWTAARDGSNPRQVTKDGFDAENATMTPDGRWLVYASAHPEKAGIWKIRTDGTEATSLAAGTYLLPEVSPDGEYALYLANPGSRQPVIRVLRVADGVAVPFEIRVVVRRNTWVAVGRARWMPGGRTIAFVGQDETGLNGVFVQDFMPGQDTTRTRRPLGGFDPEAAAESFGIASDGRRFVVAGSEQILSIAVAEGLTGIDSPLRGSP
jgi:Tol biopolymer transport system component